MRVLCHFLVMSVLCVILSFFAAPFLFPVGDESHEVVESTAVFLYGLFIEDPEWCRRHGEAIKKTIGPYPAGVATKACALVKSIASCLEPQQKQSLGSTSQTSAVKEQFGRKVAFKFEANFLSSASNRLSSSVVADSLSEDDEPDREATGNTVISTLLSGLDQESRHSPVTESEQQHAVGSGYGGRWLEEKCQNIAVAGMTWQQLHSQLLDILIIGSTGCTIENDVSSSTV